MLRANGHGERCPEGSREVAPKVLSGLRSQALLGLLGQKLLNVRRTKLRKRQPCHRMLKNVLSYGEPDTVRRGLAFLARQPPQQQLGHSPPAVAGWQNFEPA